MSKPQQTPVYNTLYLQLDLLEKIEELKLTKPTLHKALHMIHCITKNSRDRFKVDTAYTSIPKDYWEETLGSRYWKIKNLLIEAGIIECNDYFNPDEGVCFKFKVNKLYFNGAVATAPITYKHKQTVKGDKAAIAQMYQDDMVTFAESLTFNHEKLREVVLQEVDKTTDVEERREMLTYWNASIANLKPGHFRARRNRTNNRLDSNFTNMPKAIREAVMADNGLVNIDLSNSQFAILAMWLRRADNIQHTEDMLRFCNVAEAGKLYEYIQEQFKEEGLTRSQAKQIMFEVAFGYVNGKDTYGYKEKFAFLFPTVHAWIKKFKIAYGDAQFPVRLQRMEANIFIDNIKRLLMDHQIPHTTVHDSVICPEEYQEAVLDIMEVVFKHFKLVARVSVDNPNRSSQEASEAVMMVA